jgi:hypothetical protein
LILYDQNYNFLGISSETVNFLGYEDIKEFLSMNSDFANLLVQKEGKIYKFKNFSWIDFILYSGAPNKLASVTMKDGSEIDIKLTVKEITFAKEFGGFEKCYAVRIISDKFVNIASKVNENMKFEVNSNVSLSNLLTEDQPALQEKSKTEKAVDPIQEEISLSFDKPKIEDEINIPTFDFPPAEELKKEMDEDIVLEKSEVIPEKEEDEKIGFDFLASDELHGDVDEGIKIDLTSDEYSQEVLTTNDREENDFILKDSKDYEINSDLISKQTEEFSTKVDVNEPNVATKEHEPSAFNLSFLKKVDEKEEEKEEKIAQIQEQLPQETNLNFLKKYTSSDDETDKVQENKQEIIEQIKSDINEIDEQSSDNKHESIPTITSGSFVRNVFSDDSIQEEEKTDIGEFENPELIADFINESKINIMQLKSFINENNYKSAQYPIAKMNASADILNLNDIISSLNSIKSSAQLEEKETILNNIDLLEDKLNILNSKIKQEAAFS